MNRRMFLRRAGLSLAGFAAKGCSSFQAREQLFGRSNILFIFADDQTFSAIHSLDNCEVKTPNLDRLVTTGVTFTHAYNQGAWCGAICVASRTMLNTGKYLWKAKEEESRLKSKTSNLKLWPQYLSQSGYDTYFTGKWHIETNVTDRFDNVGHIRGGMPEQTPLGYNRPVLDQPDLWRPYDPNFGGYWQGGKHWSEIIGDDSCDFIKKATSRNNPFFMYLAFNAPHDPRQSPKQYVDMYPLDNIAVPSNYQAEYKYKDAIGCSQELRDEKLAPFPRTPYAVKVHRQEYYAIISHMDTQIGRILDALKKHDLSDNTYIFFTADNGLAIGCHGLMGKQNMFDHSVRIPLIIKGPGIAKGKKIDAPVYLQDIMPTTLELAGIKKPDHVQFKSLLPLLRRKKKDTYPSIYGAYMDLQRMVAMNNFKLILYPQIKTVLLYDTKIDPYEENNIADKPEHHKVIKKLFRELLRLQAETGDTLDLSELYPNLITHN